MVGERDAWLERAYSPLEAHSPRPRTALTNPAVVILDTISSAGRLDWFPVRRIRRYMAASPTVEMVYASRYSLTALNHTVAVMQLFVGQCRP